MPQREAVRRMEPPVVGAARAEIANWARGHETAEPPL
jgi:hypothetical protein